MPAWFDVGAPVGVGQKNDEEDVQRLDTALRDLNAYTPAPHHTAPVSYITRELEGGVKAFQEQNMLKPDGIVNPGGETARTIADRLGGKPRGAGLLLEPALRLSGTVGNWKANDENDVVSVNKALGGLGLMREHGQDQPHRYITKETSDAITEFQRANGLVADGWLGPGGETEQALNRSVDELRGRMTAAWTDFHRRKSAADPGSEGIPNPSDEESGDEPKIHLAKGSGPGSLLGIFGRPQFAPAQPPGRPQRPIPGFTPTYRPRPGGAPPPPGPAMLTQPPGHYLIPPDYEGPYWQLDPGGMNRRDRMIPGETPAEWTERHFGGIVYDGNSIVYTPRPGDPLAIPLVSAHKFGNRGSPETRKTTAELMRELMEACEAGIPGAIVKRVAGPDHAAIDRHYKELRSSLEARKQDSKVSRGYSLIDETIEISYKNVKILMHQDTYTAGADGGPIPREERQFLKLMGNERDRDAIIVRLPKPGLGEEIDWEAVKFAAEEICKRVREAVDKGKLGDKNDPKQLVELLKDLRRKKRPAKDSLPDRKPVEPEP